MIARHALFSSGSNMSAYVDRNQFIIVYDKIMYKQVLWQLTSLNDFGIFE